MNKQPSMHSEPDFETACQWWSDLPNIWTPIGWKDHLFRFNVLWNGTILADPLAVSAFLGLGARFPRTEQWKGQGAQFAFIPNIPYGRDAKFEAYSFLRVDDNSMHQGWNDAPAPVLWTEYAANGVLFRQEIFAHVPGAGDVCSGIEPLFAWVRLSVSVMPMDEKEFAHVGFTVDAPHLMPTMQPRDNVQIRPELALYPRGLRADRPAYDPRHGLRILEPDGRVRLGVAGGQVCETCFVAPRRARPSASPAETPEWHNDFRAPARAGVNARLDFRLRPEQDAAVDLLIPMLPTERKLFDRELALGYDAALREANRYWSKRPQTAATISVPEPFVNEAVKHSVRLCQVLTEKDPVTGLPCKILGSWAYACLLCTPMAMELIMMMDTLGYPDFVARHLEILRAEQGTGVPPGAAFKPHPGYLGAPERYANCPWLTDHGAILYAFGMHGLLSGDRAFIDRFTEPIVKACEWIQSARALQGHGGSQGILPAAHYSDSPQEAQSVWSDGWNYLGLATAVRLLKKVGHPRAGEFEREARDYRQAIRRALQDACRRMPRWQDARRRRRVLVPMAFLGGRGGALRAYSAVRGLFYLDCGPLFLVFAGVFEAAHPLMRDTLAWFRAGPQHKHYRRNSTWGQAPVLDHEISSGEPCYSWNVFHTWQAGDREKFLEGLYSLFAGALSRKTYVSCEHRGGVTGLACTASLAIWLARLAVLDDQLKSGELHLLRLMPRAWLKPGAQARFEKMATEFGPVTLQTQMSRDGRTLDVIFRPKFRPGEKPTRVVLHVPPIPMLRRIVVNGKVIRKKPRSIRLQ